MIDHAYNRRRLLPICLVLAIITCFQITLYGQTLDSLEQVLKSKKLNINERINIHKDLALRYVNNNPSRSLALSKQGVVLAKKTEDKLAEASFYYRLGAAFYKNSVYDSTTYYLEKALLIADKHEDHDIQASVYLIYGKFYRRQGMYTEALDHFQKALKRYEQLNDGKALNAVYIGIGGVHHLMKNYDQALKYYKKAEILAQQTKDPEGMARVYISLSGLYSRKGEEKEKCIYYAKEAARICHELGDSHNENEALQTIAHTYFLHEDYSNAYIFAQKAVLHAENIKNPSLEAYSNIILANVLYYQGEYQKCIKTSLKVLDKDSTDTNLKMNVYANLSKAYGYIGNPNLMETYTNRYHEVLSEQFNESYKTSLSELEVKYETEKKALKIDSLEKQRKLYTWLGIAGAMILLIALAFAMIRYRLAVSKRKLAEQETKQMEQEKQLVAVQATLDGESAERTRLAKDLHDGLGSMLSVVKFNLPQMKGGAILETEDVSRFQKAMGMLDESIQELRRVAHHMMPESLLRYGLKISLTDFCESIPMVDFHYFGNEARLSEKLEVMVYRSIHELVNNTLKHAQAVHVNVQLVQEEGRLSFTVQDDGHGFDQDSVSEGMGLGNIRQRVEAYQGKMNIYSSPQGTEIHVELELTKNDQE